jgi:arginyl-tRNA synthetase
MNLLSELRELFRPALEQLSPDKSKMADFLAMVKPAQNAEHGDYQANFAMPLAKLLKRKPPEIAQQIVHDVPKNDIVESMTIAGPGFINIRLKNEWFARQIQVMAADERLGIASAANPKTFIVDFSGPNVAKPLHVGHLRSTIIGDALARLLGFLGHDVIAQNHVGDWGTPFGMLIEQLLDERADVSPQEDRSAGDPGVPAGAETSDLNAFYRNAREKFDSSPDFARRARQRVVALQGQDPQTLGLWRELVGESERHFEDVYGLLGVLLGPQDTAGESIYEGQLADVIEELAAGGLIVESDGALVVFPAGFSGRDGEPLPLIVRKRDGAYNYATTDLAAIRYRVRELGASELLYVVGGPQRLHFEMVFAVAHEAGWLGAGVEARHVSFGSVLGEDNKMLRTRSGAPVRLVDLLNEAVERAGLILAERGVEGDDLGRLARAIGIGAVKYADLAVDREKDYAFSFDRMLSLEGNTALYLQYANARARSVLRRSGEDWASAGALVFDLRHPAERDLGLALARLPSAVDAALVDLKPHKLCTYLHGLAVAFSGFYETCPILTAADPRLRASRLGLSELTARTLELGLDLLGIEAPARLSDPPQRPSVRGA